MMRDDDFFRLRVAYLVNQYPKVSHSFIRREIQALERRGLEITRIALRGWQDRLIDAEDLRERGKTRYLLEDGISWLFVALLRTMLAKPVRFASALFLALRMGRRADRPWPLHLACLAEACRLVSWLEESGAQHLHAHFGTNSAEVAMLAHVLCGIPYSFTVHGPEEFDKPEFIGLREKIAHAAFVVAISSYGRSQLFRWSRSADWSKVRVVHCGLESAFYEVPLVALPRRPRLVCVGRLCAQKGQLLLIEAAAALRREGMDFELVLAGDGEMRGEIEAAVERHGLAAAHVRITGWISGEQVRAEILAARALVLPSFAEGLPVVVMEAMALRRPVLTTFVAGIPELVVAGESGWLFAAGSVDELVTAIVDCLETSDEDLDCMGTMARQRVLARHNVDREAAKLATLFQDSVLADSVAEVAA
ncbi:MAG: glycosyltransferase family 4 protein [Rugosibacter sp.]